MRIVLYEKKREDDMSMFRPASNERLAWLLDFISNVESDKKGAKIRMDALLSGRMIQTDMSSFVVKFEEVEAPRLTKTMTNGELYRYAWAAVRTSIENAQKWDPLDEAEIARLQRQEKELCELMNQSFLRETSRKEM